jgi:type VI secretion system secreted protein VgrG
MAYTQENRMITLDTPLGKDELLPTAFRGTEGMSRLFSFEVVALSHNQTITFEKIVGKSVTLAVRLQDGTERYFSGIVNRFSQAGTSHQQDKEVHFTEYRATVVPWLWLLTLTENSKIFQDKSVPDIVEAVFQKRGFQKGKDYALRLRGSYDKRVYCVQYRETDFHFVSRLLEEEGIHYFFEHGKGQHTLVLADDAGENKPCSQQKSARYERAAGGTTEEDLIQEFEKRMEVVSTACTLNDYNFEVPKTDLKVNVPSNKKLTDRDCEIYDYPGCYEKKAEGDRFARIRMQEEEAKISVFTAVSACRAFSSGQRFELKDYYRTDLNDKQYVLTGIVHEGSQSLGLAGEGGDVFRYKNEFTCIPHDVPFRPSRETPRPVVQGTQTAIVVGPSGEEIYTDKHGRIKVQFHWDRDGKKDENSSCWMRVGQLWAGSGWGAVYIPRIGQEVIVDFLEGDPDRPIVIGAVYHGNNKAPYPLPDEKTKSVLKSDSSLGGGGFNEIRFEDKKGSEEIFVHGQKDWTIAIENDKNQTIGHDETLKVDNDRTKTVVANQKETIGVNKAIQVGANHSEAIGANMSLTVGANKAETVAIASAETVGAGKALSIGAAYQVTVGGAMNESVGGAKAEEIGGAKAVAVGGVSTEDIGSNKTVNAGGNISETADKDYTINAKKVTVVAEDEITIKTGSAIINMKKNGDISISGKKISVKASGDIVLKGQKILEN